jgi:hypothetical protein
MFIKKAIKKDPITRKVYHYYKLGESYRLGDKTRHPTKHVLGKLDDIQSDKEIKMLVPPLQEAV